MDKKIVKKNLLPFIIGAVGIIIVLLTGVIGNNSQSKSISEPSASGTDLDMYAESLEKKIRTLCESCNGVGNVSVVVTLEGGFEYEYAKNTEYRDNSYGSDRKEEYITVGQGSSQKCVLLRQRLPMVAGVGVVCSGASSDSVKSELTLLIAATLNIGVNKIYITEAS